MKRTIFNFLIFTHLSREKYQEKGFSKILEGDGAGGFNSDKMHHIYIINGSDKKVIAFVDGAKKE